MRSHKSDGGLRIFIFISLFCIFGLITYFALGHIYGFGVENEPKIHRSSSANDQLLADTTSYKTKLELYTRSVDDDKSFIIIVFAWNRKDSLDRLMKSLLRADYQGNNSIELRINLDNNPSEDVQEYVESFDWPHGPKTVIIRDSHYGLERMVVESWDPKSSDEYAFFFEDDIEVQKDYFKFASAALKRLNSLQDPNVIGVALNTPRYDEVNLDHSIWIPAEEIGSEAKLFWFQQPCSWGALYFPEKWRQFLVYYQNRKGSVGTVIPNTYVSNWKHSWKKYFMEMMVLEGLVMLYPSLPKQRSLSIHHREQGVHTGFIGKRLNKVVDYFVVPFAGAKEASLLMESIENDDLKALPIVSFYHFRVNNFDDLKEFSRLLKEKVQ